MNQRRPVEENTWKCFTCQQHEKTEWCTLPSSDLHELDRRKVCHTYKPKQEIFQQGHPCNGLYCIQSGTVAIRKTDANGNSVLVRLANDGQALGYRSFFSGGKYSASAEALTACKICFLDQECVHALLKRNPTLALAFLKRMAEDLREAEDSILRTTVLSVRVRLAHLLLTLKESFGSVSEDGTWTLRLPLARQDIAAMLGTRPETLARTIRDLRDENVADFKGREVTVYDLDKLLDEVEFAQS
jgi:CRP-like cAMP-binding protein